MLNKKQLEELKDFLEHSQNPLFFFDNDADGLCSFLLLQRALGRGKGVQIKSFPDLNATYLRKIEELNPDAVFILDKPRVSREFIEGIYEKNLPLVWIDHHNVQVDPDLIEKAKYYNSFPTAEPVTYICHKIFERKTDLWIAMVGCISDVYMPDFAKEFEKQYPELFSSTQSAFDSLFTTQLGKIVKMFNFGLKDTITNALKFMRFLSKTTSPYDVLEENKETKQLHKRYEHLSKQIKKLLDKAESSIEKKLIFFSYSGDMSMSSELSNELAFRHKDKLIVVAYRKQDKANVSIRGKGAKKIVELCAGCIEGVTGGGHEEACGAQVPIDKLDDFKKKVEELINS